jgi:hypothetical protein
MAVSVQASLQRGSLNLNIFPSHQQHGMHVSLLSIQESIVAGVQKHSAAAVM